jgi:maleylacetoacetate isomerase
MITLYDFWRSSAAFRLRIGLNLKGLDHEAVPVNIAPGRDEQLGEAHRQRNPQARVPTLGIDGRFFGQSMAILNWLEEAHPAPPMLPSDPLERLAARGFADIIACDIHPLNNLSVLGRIKSQFGADGEATADWYRHWIGLGFSALEEVLVRRGYKGGYAFADNPTFAEICLVPQVYNARRFDQDLAPYPRLMTMFEAANTHQAFVRAAPERQPDAPKTG